ncbi:hypothetical protein HMPREF0208_03032 [Citrobacter koseri]|nr:hypothetical protein HMPREF3207_04706 [Citrobacter koseri]KWZ99699.1 hypothetical protein HMPREF3220_02123 [Citrobacter koseri]KXB42808.1 hypothetical protein HMPREF0208_03032 [Citrobacter koseri]
MRDIPGLTKIYHKYLFTFSVRQNVDATRTREPYPIMMSNFSGF